MHWLVRILLGIAISLLGFFVTWKSMWVVDMTGKSAWAEWKLAALGGTNGLYKAIGIVIIFVGFFVIVGLQDSLLGFIADLTTPGSISR